MDFKTFADAFSHNRRTKEHLLNLLSNRVDKTPEFSLFLGAGASVSSGVKPATIMINEWRKNLYASHKGRDSFHKWLTNQDWYNADDEYSRLFESIYDQPSQRRAYIELATNSAKPSWGYAYLTSLLKNNLFNVIFTTNFDDLVNEACYRFTNDLRPMVCAHDSAVTSVRLMSDRPKVIKLHGDFLYDSIKNTSSELQNLETNMRSKFIEFAKEYGLVVMGYAGNDQSIMDVLDVLVRSDNYFRNGIYWCVRPSCSPSKRLRQLLRNDRVFWVEIDGFDEFMAEVAQSVPVPLPDGITLPHKISIERSYHLLEGDNISSSPILTKEYSAIKEVYSKIQEALSSIGLLNDNFGSDDEEGVFEDLKDNLLPYLQCAALVEKNKICEAIPVLKQLASRPADSKTSKRAWAMLVECLLIEKTTTNEAMDLLKIPPPEKWQNSKHFMLRAYYALYLNKPDEALSFADRALELNANLAPAIVNKTMALFMSEKNKEFKLLNSELKNEKFTYHHRAVAHLLAGEYDESIVLLQKSFALGKYSPQDACKDVAFRVAWTLPKFKEQLSVFSPNINIVFPYLKSCPMSEAEKKLHKKILASLYKV